MDANTLQEIERAFFRDGYNIADNALSAEISAKTLVYMTRDAYEYLDTFIDSFIASCSSTTTPVVCKNGCAHCCHQSVFVLPHEAWYLYKYLKTMGNKPLFEEFKRKLTEKDKITSKMNLNEVIRFNKACPFLENSSCSIYEARPMACRLFQSMDVMSCKIERENPADFSKYSKLFDIPLRAGRMVNEGIGAWFTGKGIKSTEWVIESSMSLLISSEEIINKWIQGEEVFKRRELSEKEWNLLRKFDGELH